VRWHGSGLHVPGGHAEGVEVAEMKDLRRLVVVSHPCVLPVNQLPYVELENRGWHVDIIVPATWHHEYAPDPIIPVASSGFRGRYLPLRVTLGGRPQRHVYLTRPTVQLRQLRPDSVFIEQEPFAASALQWGVAATRLGVPFGVQAAENLPRRLPAPVRMARSWVLRNATFVAARSDAATSLVREWGFVGRVDLIPHHVPPWVTPERVKSEAFRVGYAGRLVQEKGIGTLVAAMRRLGPGCELVVAGDGPMRSWLETQDLGGSRLRLITGIDHGEMAAAYAQMDLVVLPSLTTSTWAEQFGRVLVEALWCGLPIIASDSGALPWVVELTGGGLNFAEGDAEALAEKITEMRSDPALRESLAQEGRTRVAELFSVDAVAKRLDQTLRSVLADGSARRAVEPMLRRWTCRYGVGTQDDRR